MDNGTDKRCPRCDQTLPRAAFHRNAAKADGLALHCRTCAAEFQREYRARHPDKSRELGRLNMQRRRESDPDRVRDYMRQWRADNPDLVRESKRAWEETNYVKHRAAANVANAKYKQAHPEKRREHDLKRRAVKRGATVGTVDLDRLWLEQDGRCGLCEKPLDRDLEWPHPLSPSVDHIVPLALGGGHEQSNLQWACLVCNVRKGAKMPTPS